MKINSRPFFLRDVCEGETFDGGVDTHTEWTMKYTQETVDGPRPSRDTSRCPRHSRNCGAHIALPIKENRALDSTFDRDYTRMQMNAKLFVRASIASCKYRKNVFTCLNIKYRVQRYLILITINGKIINL